MQQTLIGAALMALVLLAALKLDIFKYAFGDWAPKCGPWRRLALDLLFSDAGTIVVTYCTPST